MASDVVLFIDANQYIKLYGVVAGKEVLNWLEEQQAHIFVSAQIAEEVLRRKLDSAQTFFLNRCKEIDEIKGAIPDHLLRISDEKTAEFRNTLAQAVKVKVELTKLAEDVLSKISRSEDDVSQRLNTLFDKAISPSKGEMQRARDRKERGNPPGKQRDTLGDQITWEQLLTFCKGTKRLWIITDDRDYGIKRDDERVLLNPLLHRDLMHTCGVALELHCYSDLGKGVTEFRKNVGVTADKLPTEEVLTEIKQELDNLPPFFDSLSNTTMNLIRARPRIYGPSDNAAWLAYAAMQGVRPGETHAIQVGEGAASGVIIGPEDL